MKHERRIPAWLLRDLPALAGLFACFWLFVIPLITEGCRLIRGGKPDQRRIAALADPLLAAEATLAFALWREAYRRLGYNHRLVKLDLADLPADSIALMARIRSYMDQVQNLSRASAHYTDILRRRWSAAHVAHASTDAAQSAAAQHELVGAATPGVGNAQVALMLSSARSARPSKHERGLTSARGPPSIVQNRQPAAQNLSASTRLRTLRHARASPTPRAALNLPHALRP
jgi:hypothetical protein